MSVSKVANLAGVSPATVSRVLNGSGPVSPGVKKTVLQVVEESGYVPRRLEQLGVVEPNPAIQSNRCSTWLAVDVEPGAGLARDPSEHLEVEIHRLDDVLAMLRDGRIRHSLVIAAFAHLLLRQTGLN